MKSNKLTGLLLVLFSALSFPAIGQSRAEDLKLAISVLKGTDASMDQTQALRMLEESQSEEKDGYALNVLGIAYLHGIGTDADTAKAIDYFEEAGSRGYTLAYHNLGMHYKYAKNGEQDFYKAYETFKKGAVKNSISNCYNCGFMKYKGLGCEQNYEEAIDFFLTAANFNHADALYMLGLCYRNGYGVEPDTTVARLYLHQASDLGCQGAMEELLNEEPENSYQHRFISVDSTMVVPDHMPDIEPFIPNQSEDVSGEYRGYLATYDWSGKNIISEKPLAVSLSVNKKGVSGLWIQGRDSIPFTASMTNEGTISFDSVETDLYDRYSPNFRSRYRFDTMEMSYINNSLTGSLRLYSLDEMEPDRPMYVCLLKSGFVLDAVSADDEAYSKLYAYSVPSSNQVVLKFLLSENVPYVDISFFDRTGFNCLNYRKGALEAGEQMLTLCPNLSSGYYTVRVGVGNRQLSSIIVK